MSWGNEPYLIRYVESDPVHADPKCDRVTTCTPRAALMAANNTDAVVVATQTAVCRSVGCQPAHLIDFPT